MARGALSYASIRLDTPRYDYISTTASVSISVVYNSVVSLRVQVGRDISTSGICTNDQFVIVFYLLRVVGLVV